MAREEPLMLGAYHNFKKLFENEREGRDFIVRVRALNSSVAIMAPHGGTIEPGTTEIAEHIAQNDYSFYSFKGLKPIGNLSLHVSSNSYDEPEALALLAVSDIAITVRGLRDQGKFIYLGGLHEPLKKRIGEALRAAGFTVDPSYARQFPAHALTNICNKGKSGKGVQIEISRGLRDSADPQIKLHLADTIRKTLKR